MLYLSICITLLVIIAAMHLLAKAKKENLGSLFTWITYGIIIVASLILLCEVARGAMKMRHHEENGMHEMMMGEGMMRHHMMMGRMGCDDEMGCCDEMRGHQGNMKSDEGMSSCKGMKKCCDDDDDDADSTSHKEMHSMH